MKLVVEELRVKVMESYKNSNVVVLKVVEKALGTNLNDLEVLEEEVVVLKMARLALLLE